MALLNDVNKDIRHLILDEGVTQVEIAKRIGVSTSYITNVLKLGVINNPVADTYVRILDSIGYDIRFEYVKRKEE